MNTILSVAMKESTKVFLKSLGKSALFGAIEGIVIGAGWFGAEKGLTALSIRRAAKKGEKEAKKQESNVVVEEA